VRAGTAGTPIKGLWLIRDHEANLATGARDFHGEWIAGVPIRVRHRKTDHNAGTLAEGAR
jgi:hypothetical protein